MREVTPAFVLSMCAFFGCSGDGNREQPRPDAASAADMGVSDTAGSDVARAGVVHVVLFTHIEDASPAGTLGSTQSRTSYLALRGRLIELAKRAKTHRLRWVLQPDWKYLEAARVYEDAATTTDTAGKNVFRYLRDDLQVAIDPHSHENGGYNYTDVAHLLDLLGVGGSTVIGGHIWDPALTQFQQWDRFRVPVAGEHYPMATWRGDLLIGAGTPNHVNDPLVSGVWRPKDRDHYFEDDPAGNIVSTGAWHDGVAGVRELVELYAKGTVPASTMLTASSHLKPLQLTAPTGIDDIETATLIPLEQLQAEGKVVVTDFTSLVATWRTAYGASGKFHRP